MSIETLNAYKCFGGTQYYLRHASSSTGTDMRLALFMPPQAQGLAKVPVLFWLSGLTCTEDNFTVKAGAQRVAAELGLMIVAPDTSPRGENVPDDPEGEYDFGLGAGFYVDATEEPFDRHYKMYSYCTRELPALIAGAYPSADMSRQGIFGHSMGGHGALTIALNDPTRFKSVSAFAPISSPMHCPWGEKALKGYLGEDRAAWRAHDACALIQGGARLNEILVDQGTKDPFLEKQLKPELLEAVCADAGIALTLRRREGYDHSYFFIASFIEDHLRWHAARLQG